MAQNGSGNSARADGRFQAGFVACVVLSAIGLAVALLLLGPRRDGAAETPEAQPAAAGD